MTSDATPPAPNIVAPSGLFVFRTPLLPFNVLQAWSEDLEPCATGGDPAAVDHACAAHRATLRARLAAIVARAEVREAIFVASPSLHDSVDLWLRDPDGDRGQRAERALVRYVSRMAGRATPFGLFAGCGVGTVATDTRLVCGGPGSRHTRLDMEYLCSLGAALSRDGAVRRSLRYRPSSSLYRAGGRFRYVEARLDGGVRSHHLVSVEASDALEVTLERARDGATFDRLAAALVDDDVSLAEAERYVEELVDSQLLVSDLEVPVTGARPIDVLIDELKTHACSATHADVLAKVRSQLADVDAAGLGVPPDCYRAAARVLEALPAKPDPDRLFQVDLMHDSRHATLGGSVLEEIVGGIEILRRLSRPRRDEALQRFRSAFLERYEQCEVPLVEALDEEAGIGFGSAAETSPLLQGLVFPPGADATMAWTGRDAILLGTLGDALARGRQEIHLEPSDVSRLAAAPPLPLPNAFSVFAAVAAADDDALAAGDFLVRVDGVVRDIVAAQLARHTPAAAAQCRHPIQRRQGDRARRGKACHGDDSPNPGGVALRCERPEHEQRHHVHGDDDPHHRDREQEHQTERHPPQVFLSLEEIRRHQNWTCGACRVPGSSISSSAAGAKPIIPASTLAGKTSRRLL